jgi:arylformamidase
MSTIIDISWPISHEMTSYKNNKPVTFTQTRTIENGGMSEHNITLNTHTGTHVDAPSHKLLDGKTLDQIALSSLVGTARVIDLSHLEQIITAADLQVHEITTGDIILLKTKNSILPPTAPFSPEFVYLSPEGAIFLAECGAKAVGIDYLGIERNAPNHTVHSTLLSLQIPIIEGLRLGHVEAGSYYFVCLPLPVVGLDAAPARAILLDGEDQENRLLQRS